MTVLPTHRWGDPADRPVVCLHGVDQHGGVFAGLAERLVAEHHHVIAVDLRGHGEAPPQPPWTVATHTRDLLETIDALDLVRPAWIGHSFGGLLATAVAAHAPERVSKLALLDPALQLEPDVALAAAENDRLDWSFASVDEAVDAMLTAGFLVRTPRETLVAYAADDLRPGPDGRLRFRFCPSAAVAAWGEMALEPPPPTSVRTLLVRVEEPLFTCPGPDARLREALGAALMEVTLPGGHNVLWEAPEQAAEVVADFLAGRS